MTSKFRTNKNDIKKIYNSIKHNYVYFKIKKNEIHFFAKQDESFFCFDFGLSLSVFILLLMTWDVISTSKSIEDLGVDVVCVVAVDVFVTLD